MPPPPPIDAPEECIPPDMEDIDEDDIRPPDIDGADIRPPPDIPLIAPADLMPGAEACDATLGIAALRTFGIGLLRTTGRIGAMMGAGE